jgi:hypothetical protein
MTSAFQTLTNAINDLIESRNTDHRSDEEQQVVLARAPENLTEEINNIESRFEQLQTAVKDHGPGYAEAVSRKLDAAFEELYHPAVFIGLDGDPYDPQGLLDQHEFAALEMSVLAKFEETKVESDGAWKALCAAHAMVSFQTTGSSNSFDPDCGLAAHGAERLLAPTGQRNRSGTYEQLQD